MISDPEKLYEAWRQWVTENLGRESVRADVATRAAVEVASQGSGFDAAAASAREAWRVSAPSAQPDPPPLGRMPRTLAMTMALAIAGCVASGLLAFALVAFTGGFALIFLLYNLGLAAVNGLLLRAMRRGSRRALRLAFVLLVVGITFDVIEQGAMWLLLTAHGGTVSPEVAYSAVLAIPGFLIAIGVGLPLYFLGIDSAAIDAITSNWLVIHILTIQAPILVGLLSSRSWFASTAPAAVAESGSGGIPDAAS